MAKSRLVAGPSDDQQSPHLAQTWWGGGAPITCWLRGREDCKTPMAAEARLSAVESTRR